VTRKGGTEFWVYQRRHGDPIFALNRPILPDVIAIVSSYCQIAGNKHKSGDLWYWRENSAPGEIALTYLPKSWIACLPRRVADAPSLTIAPRHEFDPRAARGWSDYHDLNE
jgi:hypothetical protein